MTYQRVNGGEKNLNSGIRWTKEEIFEIYKLFKRIKGVNIHEHNPEIQKVAERLGRTVRSTEAQTLMFRNLERGGIYSHGNMNKLTREIWFENCEKNENIDSVEIVNNLNETNEAAEKLNYYDWNKLLLEFYFNPSLYGQEIACFPVSEEIFEDLTNYKFGKKDFFDSIRTVIGPLNFFARLNELYFDSITKVYKGKKLRKPQPDYFGFLVFMIYALSQDDKVDINVANVYDRINHYGLQVFENKWGEINSSVSKDILEPIWENLEEWSTKFKKGSNGLFYRRDPKNSRRCYVSRIERHSLFNSKQFSVIIDYLISDGYRPESIISVKEWVTFFQTHDIPRSELIIEYLSEESKLQISVLSFLNSYLKSHFDDSTIASEQNRFRVPPIKLKLCIQSLPLFPRDPIESIYFRAYSDGLEEDLIKIESAESIQIITSNHLYSNPIYLDFDLENGAMIKSDKHRYITSKRVYWLSKNQKMNEWVEVDVPTNESTFLIILKEEDANKFYEKYGVKFNCYSLSYSGHVLLQFNSLNESDFERVYNLFNPFSKIEGKIEVVSNFLLERRTYLLKEFKPKFKYIGNSTNPMIVAFDVENKQDLCELNRTNEFYQLPEDFSFNGLFQVKESNSLIKTRYNLRIGTLNQPPINVQKPELKDHEGKNDSTIEISDTDIFDLPASFNRNLDIPKFNMWHSNLFNLFKSKSQFIDYQKKSQQEITHTSGENLLKFIGLNKSISTYDFPKLIRELDGSVSINYSKRIMEYWRHLGYINFQDYGENITLNPPSLFFLQTNAGLKGFLTGYRNTELIETLLSICSNLKLIVGFEYHSEYKADLFPVKIIISDPSCQLIKFEKLGEQLGLTFVNQIDNPLNPRYVVYQLACFYTQRSVEEFKNKLFDGPYYEDSYGRTKDHRRKRIYNLNRLFWEDSNMDVENFEDGTVVRYEGFEDKSLIHILRIQMKSIIINDLSLAIFSSLPNDVLLKEQSEVKDEYNLYVPLYIGLPFWIERGLILLNGNVPIIKKTNESSYRIYEKVNIKILEVIEDKLSQKIKHI